MAGGKETPRQKMIGMMYLVLTALLALNVSKSILDAFVNIEENIQIDDIEHEKGNAQLTAVEKAGEKKIAWAILRVRELEWFINPWKKLISLRLKISC